MIFRERESTRRTRPVLEAMMARIRRREFKALLVWKLDRFGRGTGWLSQMLDELEILKVRFFSYTEAFDTGIPTGRAMIGMAMIFAQLERDLISERTTAALAAKRAQGKHVGRPYYLLKHVGGDWIVYRHEPIDPAARGGRWRKREIGPLCCDECLTPQDTATRLGISPRGVGRLVRLAEGADAAGWDRHGCQVALRSAKGGVAEPTLLYDGEVAAAEPGGFAEGAEVAEE